MNRVTELQVRVCVAAVGLSGSASLVLAIMGQVSFALAILAGSLLSVANFALLGREMISSTSPGRVPGLRIFLGYLIRLLGTGFALAVLHLRYHLPLVGLILGTLAVQAVILGAGMAAALEETITGRESGWLRGFLGLDGPRPSPGRRG